MTSTSSTTAADSPLSLPTVAVWTRLAQRCLSLTLRFDYLSGRRGSQAPRQIASDRLARASKSAGGPGGADASAGHAAGHVSGHSSVDSSVHRALHPALHSPDASSTLPVRRTQGVTFDDSERRYLAEIAVKPRLTSREEYCLVAQWRAGDRRAYEALIEGNLGLVVMFARRYQRPGVPLLDLIAEGNLGLMRAVERFDPERGFRFATYAKWWVLQSIQQAMPKLTHVVRIPLSQTTPGALARANGERIGTAADGFDEAEPTAGDGPADARAADAENDLTAAVQGAAFGLAAEEEPHRHRPHHGIERFESHDADLIDALAIDPEHEPPAAAMAAQRLRVLRRALETLRDRDRFVISARFALDDDRVWTLDELSVRFGVSIERIRQIECAAVKSLEKALRRAGESAASLL